MHNFSNQLPLSGVVFLHLQIHKMWKRLKDSAGWYTRPEETYSAQQVVELLNNTTTHLFLFLLLTDPFFAGLRPRLLFSHIRSSASSFPRVSPLARSLARSLRLKGPSRTKRCRMPRSELVSLEGALNQFSLILSFKARAPTKH